MLKLNLLVNLLPITKSGPSQILQIELLFYSVKLARNSVWHNVCGLIIASEDVRRV